MKASIPWLYWIVIGIIILSLALGFIWMFVTGAFENWLPNFNLVSPI